MKTAPAAIVTGIPGACKMLDVGRDKLYGMLRAGELDSYLDGGVRKITIASIHRRIEQRLASANDNPSNDNRR